MIVIVIQSDDIVNVFSKSKPGLSKTSKMYSNTIDKINER